MWPVYYLFAFTFYASMDCKSTFFIYPYFTFKCVTIISDVVVSNLIGKVFIYRKTKYLSEFKIRFAYKFSTTPLNCIMIVNNECFVL